MNRFLLFPFFYLLCSLSFLQFPTFAEEKSYGEYKEWSELSQEEKDGLLARWTKEKVMKVVEALKEGGALSEFVNKIPLSEEEIKRLESLELSLDKAKNYDLRGIPLNKQNLQKVELPFVHLEGANLNKADIDGADLFESKLQGAKLNGATLKGADLTRTKLQGADLSDTELQEADLGGANLEGADLSDSDLKGADFFEANLKDANLSFANLRGAILSGANL
ncbi:MAG TPA: pentapeptide repeat-containing protein, partial [Thermodesulfobacteriota bacterium]